MSTLTRNPLCALCGCCVMLSRYTASTRTWVKDDGKRGGVLSSAMLSMQQLHGSRLKLKGLQGNLHPALLTGSCLVLGEWHTAASGGRPMCCSFSQSHHAASTCKAVMHNHMLMLAAS
jgi:hypothetical protein